MKIEINLMCVECGDEEEPAVSLIPVGGYDSVCPAEYYKCPKCKKVIELAMSVTPHVDCYDPETLIEK